MDNSSDDRLSGIIPAYAGCTAVKRGSASRRWDHPRIRGVHTPMIMRLASHHGSSPHTRGAHRTHSQTTSKARIIPAYAGCTRPAGRRATGNRDHPRIRGVHSIDQARPGDLLGSSPHTRGAREFVCEGLVALGIIPAYAGCTSRPRRGRSRSADHPRIRGVHRGASDEHEHDPGSSPHTRGAPRVSGFPRDVSGIIPAYAGCTQTRPHHQRGIEDHPRIRGVHSNLSLKIEQSWGSSPHTRGAPYAHSSLFVNTRIIPAYAGCTGVNHT